MTTTTTTRGRDRVPFITVQHDWHEVVQEAMRGKPASSSPRSFWVSCHANGNDRVRTCHATIRVTGSDVAEGASFASSEADVVAVAWATDTPKALCVTWYAAGITCTAHAVDTCVDVPDGAASKGRHGWRAMAMSPGGGLLAMGGDAGKLQVFERRGTATPVRRLDLQGHVGDIHRLAFFPSGQVLLSAAADYQLRVWSALDGTCPVVLKGHRGGVTDMAILDRGRNVLSSARDGTVRLWHVGEAVALATWPVTTTDATPVGAAHPVSAIHVRPLDGPAAPDAHPAGQDRREVGTQGKQVFAAADALYGFDLASKQRVYHLPAPQPLTALTSLPGTPYVVTGDAGGCVVVQDLRMASPDRPCYTYHRTDQAITALTAHAGRVYAGTGDGFVMVFGRARGDWGLQADCIGDEADPIRDMHFMPNGDQGLYCLSRDAPMRHYCV